MKVCFLLALGALLIPVAAAHSQSGRTKNYSESRAVTEKAPGNAAGRSRIDEPKAAESSASPEMEVIRVETDLVIVPFRVTDKSGRTIADIKQSEVRIFEDGEEREVAYFSDVDQPFTVALVMDMSYSSAFKLEEIQEVARKFVAQLRPADRVMVVSFDEKPMVLCEATGDRRVLNIAIDGSRIGSGTGLYLTLDMLLNEKLRKITGRKAIVLLSDGVDTSSVHQTAAGVEKDMAETDVLIFPIKYNTYDDVQKSRRTTAPVEYDDDDKPYTADTRPVKGERREDYLAAKEFLNNIARDSGGRLFNVTSATNLDRAFADIANELRKIYSLGYYPNSERESGASFEVKVRIYRPDLKIRTKERYLRR
ncbi:MAG: VWA domain-containing protein [Pyrinomonadaceae bacterium]